MIREGTPQASILRLSSGVVPPRATPMINELAITANGPRQLARSKTYKDSAVIA